MNIKNEKLITDEIVFIIASYLTTTGLEVNSLRFRYIFIIVY